MKVSLKSGNRDKVHAELTFVAREKEIIILCGDKEVATLSIYTMDKEDPEDCKKTIPTESFGIVFLPKERGCDKNYADIWLD